jgi:hypothetical protein
LKFGLVFAKDVAESKSFMADSDSQSNQVTWAMSWLFGCIETARSPFSLLGISATILLHYVYYQHEFFLCLKVWGLFVPQQNVLEALFIIMAAHPEKDWGSRNSQVGGFPRICHQEELLIPYAL